MSVTKAPSSLILYNNSGSILIGGNAYSLAAGQCDVRAPPSSGEWDREKNSGQCAFSLVVNRSTSALPKRVQIIRTDSGCNLHPPWGIPFLKSMSAPRFRRPGMCAALMERKYGPPIAGDPLPVRTEDWSECLPGGLYRTLQTCCRCESVNVAVPATAENPLALRTLLPAVYVPPALRFWPQPRSWHAFAHCSPAASWCVRHHHDMGRH